MALSEQNKTRPHQPRHIGIPLPLQANLGHHGLHHSLHHQIHGHSSVSPSPSPSSHRRMGSSSSAGSVTFSTTSSHTSGGGGSSTIGGLGHDTQNLNNFSRAVHERSHSDTPTPLPSVDLSAESSSVTSLSNLPLRKNITSGK